MIFDLNKKVVVSMQVCASFDAFDVYRALFLRFVTIKVRCSQDIPLLLRGFKIVETNHVWVFDVIYISMVCVFLYLLLIIDWFI